jgi:replicative DNA helicase
MKTNFDRQKENIKQQTELLSYLLNDPSLYYKCYDVLRPDMFTGENRLIFDGFTKILKESKKPDVMLVSHASNIEMESVLNIFTYFSGSPISLDTLLYELFDYYAKDKLMHLAGFISTQISSGTEYELITDGINRSMSELQLGTSASILNMEDAITSLMKRINENRKMESEFSGTPTGINIIDKHIGGLHGGDLIILAGEISHGKTAFAQTCLYNSAIFYDRSVGIISHEMTTEQLTGRFCAYASHITTKKLLYARLTDEEIQSFNYTIPALIKSKIFIQDFIKRELEDTVAAIRLMVMQKHIEYVVVENAGNINVKYFREDERRTAEISKTMKALAKELDICIILVSHLSRERDGKKVQPTLNRLRHSGQLEADADIVIFVYRAELHGYETFQDESDEEGIQTAGIIKVIIAKGRNIGVSQAYMRFDEQLIHFSENNDSDAELAF